jgi:hypothetical protein
MANLRDKTDRAIAAFIKEAVLGVSVTIQITTANNSQKRDIEAGPGIVDVDTTMGSESPAGSGCYLMTCYVRAKYPAADQPSDALESRRVAIGKITDALHSVMHQSDNGQDYHYTAQQITIAANALAVDSTGGTDAAAVTQAANNSDMGNFSVLDVRHTTLTGGKPEENQFVELINFQCIVVGYGGYWN